MRFGRIILVLVPLALLAIAASRSVRLATADLLYRQGTPDSVRSAIKIEPGRALYYTGYGELQSAVGEDSESSFRRSVELKPDDAFIRIRLGLRAEAAGDFATAEEQLLVAARVSRKYEPRWTLANYYYRRGDEPEFWRWAGEALAISFGNRTALLDLCWRMDPTGRRLADVIPQSRPVERDYARFLMSKQVWEPAESIFTRQAVAATADELPGFLSVVDRLIAARQTEAAVSVWNALAAGDATPYPLINQQDGPWITNGSFSEEPTGAGFDWRVHNQPGVYASRRNPAGLRIELSGRQPGECEILHQYVAVADGRTYGLDYQFSVSNNGYPGAPNQSGLVWRVTDMNGNLLVESAPMAAGLTGSGDATLRVPNGTRCVRLALVHRRVPGSVRMEGTVNLERVTLKLNAAIQEE